ncbi:MAG: RNA 2',3'-cyclic phosphodiesterase [Opitutales bacterium]
MPARRCFVSLDLPVEIRDLAIETQDALRAKYPDLRYTKAENLHLTLKFLGEIQAEKIEQVGERLLGIKYSRFTVQLAGIGCFTPHVVWLALQGADELQHVVDAALEPLFTSERRFMGHLTIARVKAIPPPLRHDLETLETPTLSCEVTSFSLQESHLNPSGPLYQTIARYEL